MNKHFCSVLVANRGEIAARIIRTCRAQGLRSVAVYSSVDAGAPWLELADSACLLGPAPAKDSYLNIGAILQAARVSGAEAIHPGYGFLAENPDFAQTVLDAGLVWIGPPPSAMRVLGNKAAAKRHLQEYAPTVPLLPGYMGTNQSEQELLQAALRTGFPLMIKAAAGGGGRGMRLVPQALPEGQLLALLQSAASEAQAGFGCGDLILERALGRARHIEVQVFLDAHGNHLHLGERECSLQRRHQKLIEETPSAVVDCALRARLGAAAVAVAQSCAYQGAGTVEFLLDEEGQFWFMEMNTRLQVEHTVTEEVLGLDLVAWQLAVAQGEALPLTQEQINTRFASGGHAIEVRVCAEDPQQEFLPATGLYHGWQAGPGLRVESALAERGEVSPYYDSMLAKLIAHGANREQAHQRLLAGLRATSLLGLANNLDYLQACLRFEDFSAARFDTGYLQRQHQHLLQEAAAPENAPALLAAAIFLLRRKSAAYPLHLQGFASNADCAWQHRFAGGGQEWLALWQADAQALRERRSVWSLRLQGRAESREYRLEFAAGGEAGESGLGMSLARITIDGQSLQCAYAGHDGQVFVQVQGAVQGYHLQAQDLSTQRASAVAKEQAAGNLYAPLNAKVVRILAQAGQQLEAGQTIMVLEAMKMEHSVRAPAGMQIVESIAVQPGQQVQPGSLLCSLERKPEVEAK